MSSKFFSLLSQTSTIYAIRWTDRNCSVIDELSRNMTDLLQIKKGADFNQLVGDKASLLRKNTLDEKRDSNVLLIPE